MPRLLLLGGLDPSGGAGITVDAAAALAHGVQPLPIAVVLTVQGNAGFVGSEIVDERVWRAQIEAALAGEPPAAVKIGLLGGVELLGRVAAAVEPFAGRAPIVVDPVLSATVGGLRVSAGLADAYLERLVPLASLFTPNLPELAAVCGGDATRALARGCGAVLVKGGHADGAFAEDVLVTADGSERTARPRLRIGRVRGTGCALAAAAAARLARGDDVGAAVRSAGDWLHVLLSRLPPAGDGEAPRPLPLGGLPGPCVSPG
jgi:hydroxymethylpyrimidine/phosphomethylpyrimidine kinase